MIRLIAVCFAGIGLVGCQCQPRSPVYDPFAAASQRIPPPPTGALNQSSGYYQAPVYQQAPTYQPPTNYLPGPSYQGPAANQAPALQVPQLQQPQVPPGFVPVTSAPATLTPVSRTASSTGNAFASRSVPTPAARADWPPRRPLQRTDELAWNSPNLPGGVRQASANLPIGSNGSRVTAGASQISPVQPTTYWDPNCRDCDPYGTPHLANPLLPMPLGYDEAYSIGTYSGDSSVIYSADQSYSGDQWRRRSTRR